MKQKNDRVSRRNKPKIKIGDFNTPLFIIDRTSKQKIRKDIKYSNTTKHTDLTDVYKTLHLTGGE